MFRGRLLIDHWPAAIYAIGDIHGCLDEFVALEARIVADSVGIAGEKWLLTLGDHIDRGPDSAGVIERLLSPPPPGFRRLALRGNHEQVMLDFLADPLPNDGWLFEGGAETLASYGVALDDIESGLTAAELLRRIRARVPDRHLRFMEALPFLVSLPGWVFVHAGLRPGVALDRQVDQDLIWIREPFLSAPKFPGVRVVHGHTPGPRPVVTPARFGIDTHCFHTGRLTALRVTPAGEPVLLSVG